MSLPRAASEPDTHSGTSGPARSNRAVWGLAGLVAVASALGGCGGCGDGRGDDGAWDWDLGPYPDFELPDLGYTDPPPRNAIEVDGDAASDLALACRFGGDDRLTPASVVAASERLSRLEDGAVEVEVSERGCIRFRRELRGGRLVRAEWIGLTGEVAVRFVPGGDSRYFALYHPFAIWEADGAGVVVGRIDADDDKLDRDDDFYEVTTRRGADVYSFEVSDPASRQVRVRLTLRYDGGVGTQTVERRVGGALVEVERTSVDARNRLDISAERIGECTAAATACPATQQAELAASLVEALARGASCMSQLERDGGTAGRQAWETLETLKELWTRGAAFRCMASACTFAHFDDRASSGRPTIDVGYESWSVRPRNVQLGTLFHEFLHNVLGVHSDEIVKSDLEDIEGRRGVLMRRYADRVDACEAYCFADLPTRCACARCLDVKACDSQCSGLASCTEYASDPGGGGTVAIMSEAVGAACVLATPDPEGVRANWHSTVAACRMSGCESSRRGTCRSYSVSCNESCQ